MRQHPVVGERICAPLKSFRPVLPIVRHHHERMDGSGYPDGLIGEQIPLTARILQIVDVYDALRTERPYKHAFPLDTTLAVMENEVKKGWWDQRLFAEFRQFIASLETEIPDREDEDPDEMGRKPARRHESGRSNSPQQLMVKGA